MSNHIPHYMVGPPGIGKTAVAHALANNDPNALKAFAAKEMPRRLWYVSLPESEPYGS